MKLHYRKLGEGEPLLILHGLFGSADNWQSLAKQFAENHEVVLIDQRNHGRSGHDPVFDYDSMAEDLLELIYDEQYMSVNIIGHSMGGKTAMRFAQRWPELVEKLVVVDMGIKAYLNHHDKILIALMKIERNPPVSRKDAAQILGEFVPESSVRQFLLKNLHWKNKKLIWRMNVPVINKNIQKMVVALPNDTCDVRTLFIYGGTSNYVPDTDLESIKALFKNSEFQKITNAGHWIHSEDPENFFLYSSQFLENY